MFVRPSLSTTRCRLSDEIEPKVGTQFIEVVDDDEDVAHTVDLIIENLGDGVFVVEDENGDEWEIVWDGSEGGWFVTDA